MKKLICILFAVILLAAGVVPLSAGAAEYPAFCDVSGVHGAIRSTSPEKSYRLADVDVTAAVGDEGNNSPTTVEGEVIDDGINTKAATLWIIGISAAVASAILAVCVYLAKKNRNN